MRWTDVQDYFTRVVQQERYRPCPQVVEPNESFRFAAMCMLLGLDPEEGRRRVRNLGRRHPARGCAARKTLFGA